MINVSDITAAMVSRLSGHPLLLNVRDVVRGEYINTDPANTPWIGVYRVGVDYDPRTLGGSTTAWRAIVRIDIAAQVSDPSGGEETEDELELLVKNILIVVLEDRTFGNAVAAVTSISVQYDYQQSESATLDFQMATISLTLEVRTG